MHDPQKNEGRGWHRILSSEGPLIKTSAGLSFLWFWLD